MDGGALLHRLCWARDINYGELAQHYVNYTKKHYGFCYIVFDGYGYNQPKPVSINIAQVIPLVPQHFHSKMQQGPLNECNKAQFIRLIINKIRRDGRVAVNCRDDADTKIVSTALDLAENH